MIYQPQAIDGPGAQPPVYSLLIAADTPPDDGSIEWHKGITWAPEQIGGGDATSMSCTGTAALTAGTNPVMMTAEPIVVHTDDHCSVLGGLSRDFEGRARRQLLATQSFQIAREFQLGTLRDADTLDNVALKDAVAIHPGAVSVQTALAALEGALAETFKGRRGMLHLTPQAFDIAAADNFLTQSGQRWTTHMGTIVAADAGYTVEDDGLMYAYASGPVQVRLGAIVLNPGTFDDAQADGLIDWHVNAVKLHAERLALVQVDAVIADDPGSGSADAMFKIQLDVHPWALHS